ncbi:MAG: hypothetical protein Q9219_001138 [cf. Caloplaca sp. 3 TL-2023]
MPHATLDDVKRTSENYDSLGYINDIITAAPNNASPVSVNADSTQIPSNGVRYPMENNQPCDQDPIAVIGMSVKFPQEATSLEAFWQMLINGRSALSDVPKERFNIDAFHNPDSAIPGTMNARGGYFINEDLASFDAPFFSISPAEAECIDPQQRWLLETTYHALENDSLEAGIPLEKVATTKTAVHVGSFMHDYETMLSREPESYVPYKATGISLAMLANRISWFFNLTGPSIAIDTACSSSLNALELSCQSLRTGQSTMNLEPPLTEFKGIVAGSNLIFNPDSSVALADLGFLSPDSKCYSFDHRANGYARGEGIAVVVIKRLSEALRDNDTIRAVIRATGSNQDGRTPGVSQPSSKGQGDLIRQTYAAAGLHMADTDFLESHGTGTSVGDPIEISGIQAAFGTRDEPLYVGAVKTNVGHLEGASDDAHNYLRIQGLEGRHSSGISALDDDESSSTRGESDDISKASTLSETSWKDPRMMVFSTQHEAGLKRLGILYGEHLSNSRSTRGESQFLTDLAYTLAERRTQFPWRTFVVARTVGELQEGLEQNLPTFHRSMQQPRILFAFTGQGAEWSGMGRELFRYPVFRKDLEVSQTCLHNLGCEWDLLDQLTTEGDENMHRPAYSQVMVTALQIALIELLLSWGIKPSCVIGHSSGEIAAAYCIGGLSRDSALQVAYHRGRLANTLIHGPSAGTMIAVGLSESDIKDYLSHESLEGKLCVACINSSRSTTVAGPVHYVDKLKNMLEADGVFQRKLNVGVAYHSGAMQSIGTEYKSCISDIRGGRARFGEPTLFSSLTGRLCGIEELNKSEHWVQNMVSPVKFLHAFHQAMSSGRIDYVCEIGPHQTLRGPIMDMLKGVNASTKTGYTSVLVRDKCAIETAMTSAGALYCIGCPVNLSRVNHDSDNKSASMITDLPAYPFNRSTKFWLETRQSKNMRFRKTPSNALLGHPTLDWNGNEPKYNNVLRVEKHPWVEDHKINGSILYPAAGFLVMAIEAARQVNSSRKSVLNYHLRDITFDRAVKIPPNGSVELQIALQSPGNGMRNFLAWSKFRIYVYEGCDAIEASTGQVALEYGEQNSEDYLTQWDEAARRHRNVISHCKMSLSQKQFYSGTEHLGYSYGPTFQSLTNIRYNLDGDAAALLRPNPWPLKTSVCSQPSIIHPAALDAILQIQVVGMTRGTRDYISTMIPTRITRLRLSAGLYHSNVLEIEIAAKRDFMGARFADYTISGACPTSSEVHLEASVETTAVGQSSPASSRDHAVPKQLCYNVDWKPDIDRMSQEQVDQYSLSHLRPFDPVKPRMLPQRELLCYLTLLEMKNTLDVVSIPLPKPHLGRYIEWMNNRALTQDPSFRDGPSGDSTSLESLRNQVEQLDAEGKLLATVSHNLRGIFEGEVDPVQLFFEGDLMDNYYRYINSACTSFHQLVVYINLLVHKYPNMKILEIGAGTGSATRDVFAGLVQGDSRRFQKYIFTDLSPSFFAKAMEEFADFSDRMVFMPLDIEKDPLHQGFEADNDVVLASNVLHATVSLKRTLQNARKLLKTGGKLILYEGVDAGSLTTTFAFGLLSGWWNGAESFRKWGPLVDERTWNELLMESGFSSIEVSFQDTEGTGAHKASLMIASAVDNTDPLPLTNLVFVNNDKPSQGNSEHTSCDILKKISDSVKKRSEDGHEFLSYSQLASKDLKDTAVILSSLGQEGLLIDSPYGLEVLQKVVTAAAGLVWVYDENYSGSHQSAAAMTGLLRCIQNEHEDLKIISVQVPGEDQSDIVIEQIAEVIQKKFLTEPSEKESEYQSTTSLLEVPRLIQASSLNATIHSRTKSQKVEQRAFGEDSARNLKLAVGTPGLLDSLRFIDDATTPQTISSDEIEVEVKAAGVNFRDVLIASGQLKSEVFGSECSGIVTQAGQNSGFQLGDRVVSVAVGSYQRRARCKAAVACKLPETISYAAGAALPTPFITAYYCLLKVARIQARESVLIHSAAGGTGQACIQLAKMHNATIYATAGTEEKRLFLHTTYDIPKENIFTSRDPTFATGIKKRTGGQGVDIVINSLTGEALKTTWEECLAPLGRFVEIGKKDISSFGQLPMAAFANNKSFTYVDLVGLYAAQDPSFMGDILREILVLLEEGKISLQKPLEVFNASQIQDAFRWMQSGKNMGKAVIEFGDEDIVSVIPSTQPSYCFDLNATYVIAGGSGGLGRSIARWMASRNARSIILLSRSGSSTQATKDLIDELSALGVRIATPSCDVGDRTALEQTLDTCLQTMPPIKGCIQGAMVLKDALFVNMTHDDFTTPLKPKIQGSWNLHTLLPKQMDFFVLLSSIAGVIGNRGQSNYAAGNTYQDALARYRVAQGEKAVSIDLGNVRHVGYIAEHDEVATTLKSDKYLSIDESELLAMLEHFCDPGFVPTAENCQVVTGIERAASLRRKRFDEPPFMKLPMFSHLHIAHGDDIAGADAEGTNRVAARTDYGALLSSVGSLDEAAATVTQGLIEKLSSIMALAAVDVDASKPLHSYGIDSLAAVEMKTWLAREIGSDVAVFDILSGKSIEELGRMAAGKSAYIQKEGAPPVS